MRYFCGEKFTNHFKSIFMKNLYTLIAAMLLLAVGNTPAYAQYKQGDEPLVTITDGQKVLLQNGREEAMTTSYLKWYETPGTAATDFFTDKVDDNSVMQFVDAGDGSYYLYNPAHKAYIEDANYQYSTTYSMYWTTDKSKAARFAPSEEIVAADHVTPALMLHHEEPCFNMTTWYLTPANVFGHGAGYTYLLLDGYEYYNAWVIYAVEETGGKSYLENVLETYFPDGIPEGRWVEGTAPGCVPTDIYAALTTAYSNAVSVYNNSGSSEEEYTAAADALMTAYNNVAAAIVPITPGYYYIRNGAFDAYIYASSEGSGTDIVNRARWAGVELPEQYEASIAPYIWKIEAIEGSTGFRFYNPYFEKYLTRSGSYGMPTPLQADGEQTGTFGVTYQNEAYSGYGGCFNITNSYFGGRILRAIGAGVGYSSDSSDPKDDDALWQFIPVPEGFIQAMENEKTGNTLLAQMSELVENSNVLLANTKVYDSPMTINGLIDTPGLINDLTTNAQEPTEGDAAYAIDGDVTSFFHTLWSDDSAQPEGRHNFSVDLAEPVQTFALKIVKRTNATGLAQGSPYYPTSLIVYTVNGGEADSVCSIKAIYNQGFLPFEGSTEPAEDMVSVNYITLPAASSNLRFDVVSNGGNSEPYFCFSEVGIFKAEYNATASPYENIPEEVRTSFLAALAAAEAELVAGNPTNETLQALQEAYEAMDDAFADRSELRALLDEARSYVDEAIEQDEEPGYYAEGSIDVATTKLNDLETVIESLVNPSAEEFQNVKTRIEAVMDEFDSKLNKPSDTSLYYIQSASAEGDNYYRYLFTTTNDVMGARLNSTDVADPGAYLYYMWRIEPQSDGNFYVRNAASGMYLGGYDTRLNNVTSTYEPTPLRIVSARTPGALTLQTTDGESLFALDFQQGITLREGTKGPDGAAFSFIPAGFEGMHTTKAYPGTQIVTLPFGVFGSVIGGVAYQMTGRITSEGTVTAQLEPYDGSAIIPAATPFVLVVDEGTEEIVYLTQEGSDGMAIEYVLTPGTAPGLVGTLASENVMPPYGVLRNNKIDIALSGGQTVGPNSGYFDVSTLEETTVAGQLQIPITDAVSAIRIVTGEYDENAPVYDLQGRRVLRLQKGGVYIIGGRKVIVK